MSTLTKTKKTGPKIIRRARPGPRAVRLVPPPGRKAAEIADLLPPPSANFDAAAVAAAVARRSNR